MSEADCNRVGGQQVEGSVECHAEPHHTTSGEGVSPTNLDFDVIRDPDPRKSLHMLLEDATVIRYEARDEIPGVVFIKQGEDEHRWTPVIIGVSADGGKEFDARCLNQCKSVKFFMSESGPSFSIHCSKSLFPTLIAC